VRTLLSRGEYRRSLFLPRKTSRRNSGVGKGDYPRKRLPVTQRGLQGGGSGRGFIRLEIKQVGIWVQKDSSKEGHARLVMTDWSRNETIQSKISSIRGRGQGPSRSLKNQIGWTGGTSARVTTWGGGPERVSFLIGRYRPLYGREGCSLEKCRKGIKRRAPGGAYGFLSIPKRRDKVPVSYLRGNPH